MTLDMILVHFFHQILIEVKMLLFCSSNCSSVQIDNKKKDILVCSKVQHEDWIIPQQQKKLNILLILQDQEGSFV